MDTVQRAIARWARERLGEGDHAFHLRDVRKYARQAVGKTEWDASMCPTTNDPFLIALESVIPALQAIGVDVHVDRSEKTIVVDIRVTPSVPVSGVLEQAPLLDEHERRIAEKQDAMETVARYARSRMCVEPDSMVASLAFANDCDDIVFTRQDGWTGVGNLSLTTAIWSRAMDDFATLIDAVDKGNNRVNKRIMAFSPRDAGYWRMRVKRLMSLLTMIFDWYDVSLRFTADTPRDWDAPTPIRSKKPNGEVEYPF